MCCLNSQVLRIHTKNMKLDEDVNLETIARCVAWARPHWQVKSGIWEEPLQGCMMCVFIRHLLSLTCTYAGTRMATWVPTWLLSAQRRPCR